MKEMEAGRTHRDNDDARLGDDFLGQAVEGGVRDVFKGPQLPHPVV